MMINYDNNNSYVLIMHHWAFITIVALDYIINDQLLLTLINNSHIGSHYVPGHWCVRPIFLITTMWGDTVIIPILQMDKLLCLLIALHSIKNMAGPSLPTRTIKFLQSTILLSHFHPSSPYWAPIVCYILFWTVERQGTHHVWIVFYLAHSHSSSRTIMFLFSHKAFFELASRVKGLLWCYMDSVPLLSQHLRVLAAACLASASPSGAEATSLSLCFQGQAQKRQPLDVGWILSLGNRLQQGWGCDAHHHIP